MTYRYRDGITVYENTTQDRFLKALYGCLPGRCLVKLLIKPFISEIVGAFMCSPLSVLMIKPFVRKNNMDMNQFERVRYKNYNQFFSRKIKQELRPVAAGDDVFISPCDSKLLVYDIRDDCYFNIKHTYYTVASVLKNKKLAKEYAGGKVLVFRLTVDDYHRYCFCADGSIGKKKEIPGILHTVNPISNDYYPIYKENAREYIPLYTSGFGKIICMEVGAMMIGKIVNHRLNGKVRKGQEKGYFRFGGSTVALFVKKDTLDIDEDILNNSRLGIETVVKYGESIGESFKGRCYGK